MRTRFIRTINNPSPQCVQRASCGAMVHVPFGHEVQVHHFGEDGEMPVLVQLREYLLEDQQGRVGYGDWQDWQDWQDWYQAEITADFYNRMDEVFLDPPSAPCSVQEAADCICAWLDSNSTDSPEPYRHAAHEVGFAHMDGTQWWSDVMDFIG